MQILETLMHDDTDRINIDSVNPKPFTDVNRPRGNLNPNNPKFYFPSDTNLIHKSQSTNPVKEHVVPSTSYSKKFE